MSVTNFPKEFPCPICGLECRVRLTKKEKPYYVCLDCGVQVFIRAPEGVKKFAALKGSDLLRALKSKNSAVYSMLYLKNEEIEIKKAELNKLEEKLPLFGNEKIELKINELKDLIEKLETEYFQQLTN